MIHDMEVQQEFFKDLSFKDKVKIHVKTLWNDMFNKARTINMLANANFTFRRRRTIPTRIYEWLYAFLTGNPFVNEGAWILYIAGYDPDEQTVKFSFVNDLEFESDNTIWFNALTQGVESLKKDPKFEWPARAEDENPMMYRERMRKLPGIEDQRVIINHFERITHRGFYMYDATGRLICEMDCEVIELKEADIVRSKAEERGIKVVDFNRKDKEDS